jgi:hypothetical protein
VHATLIPIIILDSSDSHMIWFPKMVISTYYDRMVRCSTVSSWAHIYTCVYALASCMVGRHTCTDEVHVGDLLLLLGVYGADC